MPTPPKFKSDNRPSDTKSVVLHRENDRRLFDHLKTTKKESAFWRESAYFYLDFMAWLATQPGAPDPGQSFIHYQAWLESLLPSPPGRGAGGEGLHEMPPEFIEELAAAILPGVRGVVEAALVGLSLLPSPSGTTEGRAERGAGGEGLHEMAELFSADLVLE